MLLLLYLQDVSGKLGKKQKSKGVLCGLHVWVGGRLLALV